MTDEKLHANLLLAIDLVDAAALTVLMSALRIIIDMRKDMVQAELLHESYRVALACKPRPRRIFRLNDKSRRYERATVYE